jgi:hypothetical protein
VKKPTKGNKITVVLHNRRTLRVGTVANRSARGRWSRPLGADFTVSLHAGGWATCLAKDEGVLWTRGWHLEESVEGKALLAAAALVEGETQNAVRYYAVDSTNGNDSNKGYSDVSAADAMIQPVKTMAELTRIIPRVGGGRKIEITVATGGEPAVVDGLQLGPLIDYGGITVRGVK